MQRIDIVSSALHKTSSADWDKISLGVPQGFILGPSLFFIYIRDICKILSNISKPFPFADGTSIILTDSNPTK